MDEQQPTSFSRLSLHCCVVKLTRPRIAAFALSVLGALCLGFVFVVVLISTLHLHQNNRRDNIINEEGVLVTRWAAECRTAVMEAIYAVYTLNGFVRGSFTEMPPLGGTVEQRLANQYFPRFNGSAELIASDPDSRVVSLMLLPGGVVSQAYPIGPLGLDIMQGPISTTYPTPIDTAHRGEPTILGHTTNVYMPELTGEIIEVREPIYNRDVNLSTSQPLSSLWGFAVAILTVDSLIHNSIADRLVLRYQMDYLMYVNHTISDTERELIFVTSSLGESMSDEEMHEFIDTGSIRPVLPTRLNWYIAVRSRRSWRIVTSTVWVLITIGAVVLAIILATIATIAMLYITREYNGRRYAPKAAPFAVLTVGPARGEELWALASNQMVTVVDELMDVNHRFMKAHHSYQMVQLWPFTSSYVLPTVEEAVRMGFDILEELQKNPLDRHLRQLIGDDERLLLTCAVHWCTDATVTEDKVEDALLYAGPDVAYAGRMWVFSSPNTVTLSEAARACCCTESGPAINGWSLTPLSSVYLRGVPVLQELFTIMDENSRYQREAHVTALAVMEHRRRAREEQLLAERRHGNMWGGGEATAVSTTTTAMPSGSPTAVESATSTNSSFSGTPASVVVGRGGGTVFSPLQRKSRVVAAVKRTASSVQLRANNRITTSGEWGASLDDLRSDSDAGGVGGSTVMAHRTTAVVGAAATTVPGTQLITNVPTSATTIPTSGATSAIQEEPLPLVGSSSSAILPPPPLIRDELCAVEKVAPMHSMAISSPATATAHVVQGLTVTAPSLVLPDPSGGLLAHLDNPLELHDDADGWSPLSLRTPHGGLDDFSPLGAIMGPLPSFATDAADETEARVVVPSLPLWLDRILRTAFERQALTLPTSYDSVRILVFYFFTSYDLLFKPLTSMERTNVQRRLATAFGVPTQCITQHLAARCATRYLQQHQEITTGA